MGMGAVGVLVQLRYVDANGGQVIYIQEFPFGCTGSPDCDRLFSHYHCIVNSSDQRRNDMTVLRVVIVSRAVKVAWHDAAEISAVLSVIALTHLDACDLGDGVRLVGGFERAGEQVFFLDRLRAVAWVDATGAEKKQLLDAGLPCFMDHVALDHQILVDELGRVGVVGMDAAHLGSSEIDLVDALALEEGADSGLVGEVKFGMGAGDQVGVSLGLQCPNDGGSNHAAMAGDVDACIEVDFGHCVIRDG